MSSKPPAVVRVAAAQLAPVFMNRGATVEKAVSAITESARNGAQLIAFPEAFLPGYPYWALTRDPMSINDDLHALYQQSVEVRSAEVSALCDAARAAGIQVVMGMSERAGGTLYNAQLFIDETGAVRGTRRKLMPTSHERMVWGRGDGRDLSVMQTPLGVVGGLICYEHAMALARYALQAQGEQIHIAGWLGGMPSIHGIIDAAVRHYAFEGQCFVISVTSVLTREILEAVARDGAETRLSAGGGYTQIIDPRGSVLAGPLGSDEGILYADLEMARIDRAKMIVDCAGHYARPDILELRVRRQPQSSLHWDLS